MKAVVASLACRRQPPERRRAAHRAGVTDLPSLAQAALRAPCSLFVESIDLAVALEKSPFFAGEAARRGKRKP